MSRCSSAARQLPQPSARSHRGRLRPCPRASPVSPTRGGSGSGIRTRSRPVRGSASSPMRHRLFEASELPLGSVRRVVVEGVGIVVTRLPDGCVHALRDICPHQGAMLSIGIVFPLVESGDVGDYDVSDSRFILRCPWHGFEFETETGRCVADPERYRVRAYKAWIDDGEVILER